LVCDGIDNVMSDAMQKQREKQQPAAQKQKMETRGSTTNQNGCTRGVNRLGKKSTLSIPLVFRTTRRKKSRHWGNAFLFAPVI
jgi:hypothetical protein